MTTMHGAAMAVAAEEQLMFDVRHMEGAVGAEAANVFALPGRAAGAARSLFELFRHAAEHKKEEQEQAQFEAQVHKEEKSNQEAAEERKQKELAEYRQDMARLIAETDQAIKEGDQIRHSMDEKHKEAEIVVDGREVVLLRNGKLGFEDTREELKNPQQLRKAKDEIEQKGGFIETEGGHDDYKERKVAYDEARGNVIDSEKSAEGSLNKSDPSSAEQQSQKTGLIEAKQKFSEATHKADNYATTVDHYDNASDDILTAGTAKTQAPASDAKICNKFNNAVEAVPACAVNEPVANETAGSTIVQQKAVSSPVL